MKTNVLTLENKAAGDIELSEAIFGLPERKDILHRMVQWQRAKAQAGTHKTKGISEISGSTKRPWKQKGSGRARQGSIRSPQWRGGATIFGPVVRSHATSMPKKVRALALKTALSVKHAKGDLIILEDAKLQDAKTKNLVAMFAKMGLSHALIIDSVLDEGFAKAARNIKHIDMLPTVGANVYDILRHRKLVLTRDAVRALEERLS